MQNKLSFKPEDVEKMDIDTLLMTFEILVEQLHEQKKALENGG